MSIPKNAITPPNLYRQLYAQLAFIEASSVLSDTEVQLNPVDQVNNYLRSGFDLSKCSDDKQQEQLLLSILNQLIDQATDPLNDSLLRRICLDNIYQPMNQLRHIYVDNPSGQRTLNTLTFQLNQLFNYCSGRC